MKTKFGRTALFIAIGSIPSLVGFSLAFLNNGGRPWYVELPPVLEKIAYPFNIGSAFYACGDPSRFGQAFVVALFYLPVDLLIFYLLYTGHCAIQSLRANGKKEPADEKGGSEMNRKAKFGGMMIGLAIAAVLALCAIFYFTRAGEDICAIYESGDKESVYRYVESGKNVCVRKKDPENNLTLFTTAIINDDKALCDMILDSKSFSMAFELSPKGNEYTCLHAASTRGCDEIVRRLLPLVHNINIGTPTPLMCATARGHHGTMKILLAHPSMDVNFTDDCPYYRITAAHCAAGQADLTALKLLHAHGADFSIKDLDGMDVRAWVENSLSRAKKELSENEAERKEIQARIERCQSGADFTADGFSEEEAKEFAEKDLEKLRKELAANENNGKIMQGIVEAYNAVLEYLAAVDEDQKALKPKE